MAGAARVYETRKAAVSAADGTLALVMASAGQTALALARHYEGMSGFRRCVA
jgi:hypothetical protein